MFDLYLTVRITGDMTKQRNNLVLLDAGKRYSNEQALLMGEYLAFGGLGTEPLPMTNERLFRVTKIVHYPYKSKIYAKRFDSIAPDEYQQLLDFGFVSNDAALPEADDDDDD